MVSTFSARGVRETRRVRPPSRSSFSPPEFWSNAEHRVHHI